MKLYNTLSRKLQAFHPENPESVKIYTCGPTVYSQPHIGNFAAYVYWDLLVRALRANGYGVKRVLNLTDVGHLTSDADNGEDKLEKGARITGKSVWEVAEYYINAFQTDFRKLNCIEPDVWARATDYIEQDKQIVDLLTTKGYTYETTDGIYYDTSKFPRYPDFARLDLENLRAGARVDYSLEKKHPSDFAVWKFIQPDELHAMRWDYLGRPGYPGWHLECSTIIHTELGEPIDIHTGGIDHIPVHHTNEIAQTEAAFDKRLANYWLHCNFLTINKQKISKSLGNVITLHDLEERKYSALDFKMWVLQGHYESERDFTYKNLDAARTRRLNWRNRIALAYQKPGQAVGLDDVLACINDNLNSPRAFALIDAVTDGNLDFWQKIDELFGLGLINESPNLGLELQSLLNARLTARATKNFAKADEIRNQLLAQGVSVLDTPDGQIWQFVK